ncbi:MAG: hypothetical protein JWO90_547, partial [Solirubrobacterales bacterium]|nr:hypothetical protein [Solirubrobacterales bacterium]
RGALAHAVAVERYAWPAIAARVADVLEDGAARGDTGAKMVDNLNL